MLQGYTYGLLDWCYHGLAMRSPTRDRISRSLCRKNTACGLTILLLLSGVPTTAVAKGKSDWSQVQAVAYDTRISVRLYKDSAPRGQRRFKGHLVSATDGSISIVLEDGQTRTFLKSDVRRVQTPLPFIKRGAGWAAMGISGVIAGVLLMVSGTEGAEPGEIPALIGIVVGIPTLVGFLAGKMGPIYDVPAKHRMSLQGDQQSGDPDNNSG